MFEFKCRKSKEEIAAKDKAKIIKMWEFLNGTHFAYLPVSRNDGTGRCFWWTHYRHDHSYKDFDHFDLRVSRMFEDNVYFMADCKYEVAERLVREELNRPDIKQYPTDKEGNPL